MNLISVVIPVFNHENFLIDCLESIRRDKYSRIEIILIDDGSVDNSFEVAVNWLVENESRFESVRYEKQENAGIVVTLNRLVALSRGEYIFPLASDDQVAENGIYNMVLYYESHCMTPTLLLSDVELIDQKGELYMASGAEFYNRNQIMLEKSKQYLILDVLLNWSTPFQHHFYPRILFDSIGGYTEKIEYEDLYFALKNMALGSIAYAPIKSKRYRLRPNLTTTPGISEECIRPIHARRLVMRDFLFPYNVLISLLNFKDVNPGGLQNKVARAVLLVVRKCVVLYFRKATKQL